MWRGWASLRVAERKKQRTRYVPNLVHWDHYMMIRMTEQGLKDTVRYNASCFTCTL
jgi:hypothetical protein